MDDAYVGLGSNLGDKRKNISDAIRLLGDSCDVVEASPIYETEPVDMDGGEMFLNCVLKLRTKLTPRKLLDNLLDIEQRLGRVRSSRNSPRTIDIDLLFYGDIVLDEAGLSLPHPRLHRRMFVLKPLNDIAPELIHPLIGKTVKEMLADIS